MSYWVKHYEMKPDASRIICTPYLLTIISPILPRVHFTCRTLHINIMFLPVIAQPRRLKPTVHFRTEHTYISAWHWSSQASWLHLWTFGLSNAVFGGPCIAIIFTNGQFPTTDFFKSSLNAVKNHTKQMKNVFLMICVHVLCLHGHIG